MNRQSLSLAACFRGAQQRTRPRSRVAKDRNPHTKMLVVIDLAIKDLALLAHSEFQAYRANKPNLRDFSSADGDPRLRAEQPCWQARAARSQVPVPVGNLIRLASEAESRNVSIL